MRAAKGRPYGVDGSGALAEKAQAQKRDRAKSKFCKLRAQWPGKNRTQALLILRAGNYLPTQRDNPRKRGPGKGDYEHEVLIWSRPRWRFGSFAAMGKGTRRPQAAKSPSRPLNKQAAGASPRPTG